MDKQFTVGWVFVTSVLGAYFLLGILSSGGVIPPLSVLVLVLVLWFSVYKLRHKGLDNRDLVRKMRTDLEGKFEGISERMAQQEARRLAALEKEKQARLERERRRAEGERRRASSPTKDPAVGMYADMIESRLRERERSGRGFEAP